MSAHPDAGYSSATRAPLLRAGEVAVALGVSPATVWRLSRTGEIRRIRVGGSTRFDPLDVEHLIARGRENTEAQLKKDEDPAGMPGLVKKPASRGRRARG